MVEILKVILLNAFLLGSCYFIGSAFIKKISVANFAWGFCVYFGILELFSFWTVSWRQKKVYFIIIAIVIYLAMIILALRRQRNKIDIKIAVRENWIWLMITVILIVLVALFYRSDADDSFYVSNATLFQNSSILNAYDSSFGIKELGTVPMYDFQIWESFIAIISSLFHLESVSIMHVYILPTLLITSASAYLYLGSALLKTESILKSTLFYSFITLFHLFGGYAVYSEGSFLLSRQWQGKAVYLTIVLPVMTSIMLNSIHQNSKNLWVSMAVCMLAGMALNPTSLYVLGFELLFGVLAIGIYKKSARYFLNIIPPAFIAVFFTIMIYLRTKQYSGQIEAASQTNGTFVIDTFRQFWDNGTTYLVIYILCIALILWRGSIEAKVYSAFIPALLLLFIWNPYLGRFIAEKVTMVPSYWRVFWLLPVGTSIAYAFCLICETCNKKLQRLIVGACGVIMICLPGKWMFSVTNGFVLAENSERLPNDVIRFGREIDAESDYEIVLGGDEFSTTLRQKYDDIELVYSRYQYILDLFLYRGEEQQATDRSRLMDFANGNLIDYNDVERLLDDYNVDYVILSVDQENECEFLNRTGDWTEKDNTKENILFERVKRRDETE